MSNLFNFGKAMASGETTSKRAEKLHDEARNFDLAGTGGFLSVVKYIVFTILACLNFHLFYVHVPGIWGVALGSVAVLFECCAVYFWNKQNKSAGAHKMALQVFAVTFTTMSFIHGCAALYQISVSQSMLDEVITFYSEFVAFPLLFGLMVLSVCVLHYLHWSTRISESRAKTLLDAERGRADLITQALELEHKAEIEQSRLAYFEQQIIQEEKYVAAIERFAAIKQRGLGVVNSITDPEVRQELLNAIGKTGTIAPAPKRINPLPAMATDPKAPAPQE